MSLLCLQNNFHAVQLVTDAQNHLSTLGGVFCENRKLDYNGLG